MNYDYIKFNEASDLPKLGDNSCFIIQRDKNNYSNSTKICSATILSNHQVAYDKKCLYKINPRENRENELNCLNQSIKKIVPYQAFKGRGLGVLTLSSVLPVSGPKLEKEKKFTDPYYEKCFVKTANKYINLKPLDSNTKITSDGVIKNSILNSSDIGGGVFCTNKNGEEIVIGAIDENFKIRSIKQIEDENKLTNLQEKLATSSENINQKCGESQFCLDNLSTQTSILTNDTLAILNKLKEDFRTSSKVTSAQLEENLFELELDFEKIRLECNKINIQLKQKSDSKVETGILSSTMGFIEDYGISAIELFSSDFLLNQFKDVKIIGENLDDREIKKIYEEVKAKYPTSDNIELIKKATAEFTDKIIQKLVRQMDLTRISVQKFNDFKNSTRKDFDSCLKLADSKDKVLECSDKFALSASVKISEIELDNQLEENFKKLFENTEDYLNLTISAKDTFYRCINKFFYNQKAVDNSSAAKGCVLQSIITAFNKTKDQTIRKYIVEAGVKAEEVQKLTSLIDKNSKSCNNYDVIFSTNTDSLTDLRRLSAIEPDDFKTYLFDCIEKLSLTAGRIITQESVKNHPQITQIIKDSKEIDFIVESVALRLYDECINVQKTSKDANKCRDLITAGTSLEVAKTEINKTIYDLSEGDEKLRNTLTLKVKDSMNLCAKSLEQKHLEALSESKIAPSEKATTNCLKDAVLLIVEDVTRQTVDKSIKKEEIAIPYLEEIVSNSQIKAIPSKVKECFSQKLSKTSSINEFTGAIDETKATCQFNAEKEAVAIIAPIVLFHKLEDALGDKKEAQRIAKEYTSGKTGLVSRINNASSKDELTTITNQITLDLTIKGANFIIPNLVEEMLPKFSNQIKDKITKELLTSLNNCILTIDKMSANQTQKIDECINLSTKKGYEEISARIIFKNIDDVLGTDKDIAQKLFKTSKERFIFCAEKISPTQASTLYKQTINKCMIEEVANLSFEIPREAILLYAPAAGLEMSQKEMREKLVSIERMYENNPKTTRPKESGQYILDSHIIHMECITNARTNLKRVNETDMSKVQAAYSKCTDNVEKNIKLGIAEIFARTHSTSPNTYSSMYNLGKTLIQLTSNEPDTTAKSSAQDSNLDLVSPTRKPLSETFSQMHLVGNKFKLACEKNPTQCQNIVKTTLNDITTFKATTPKASGDDLFNRFIESDVMDFVVTSEISISLNQELKTGMKDYLDDEGILLNSINNITSPVEIEKLLKTKEGIAAKAVIIQAIKDNTIDAIMENQDFRKMFAKVLTTQTQNDSFIDKLIFGLIQPKVKEEKKSSNGLFGIFKNPKVSLGRLLGIVSGKDFDWNRIRNTKDGQKAREIFAKEIFAPIVEGIELDKIPATDKKYNNRVQELTAQIEELIVKGVKSL